MPRITSRTETELTGKPNSSTGNGFRRALQHTGLWRTVLVLMAVPLALIAFWPTPVDRPIGVALARVLGYLHQHGIPSWVDYAFVEASANVVLFIPVGVVAALAFPRWRFWQVVTFGFAVSGCIEICQGLFLPARFASPMDLAVNTVGTVLGAVLALLWRRQTRQPN